MRTLALAVVFLATAAFSFAQDGTGIGDYNLLSTADRALAFDYDSSGKQDHMVLYRPGTGIIWILKNTGGNFAPVFESDSGIGDYDLGSEADRIIAFDCDGSGKKDHLVVYRPGDGIIWILKKNADGSFSPVYVSSYDPNKAVNGGGIGGYDLGSAADQIIAFDYDGSGKEDHLLLYRPGTGVISILKNNGGVFSPVLTGGGIGGFNLLTQADRIISFDYDGSGKKDHLVVYRPGNGIIWILKNVSGTFSAVYVSSYDPNKAVNGGGIGGYDLGSAADQIIAFDYDGSGKQDHLLLYRPGTAIVWILKNTGGTFSPVLESESGIGDYNLLSPYDEIFSFDYNSTGLLDHLVLYRPGDGIIWIEQNSGGTFAPIYQQANYPLRTISGKVLAGETPVAGVVVTLGGMAVDAVTTDANGSYSFTVGSGGNYIVTPVSSSYTFSPPSQTISNLAADEEAIFVVATNGAGAGVAAREYIYLGGRVVAVEAGHP